MLNNKEIVIAFRHSDKNWLLIRKSRFDKSFMSSSLVSRLWVWKNKQTEIQQETKNKKE